jgi:hypothetical protein
VGGLGGAPALGLHFQPHGPDTDFTTIVKSLEEWAGVEVKPGG